MFAFYTEETGLPFAKIVAAKHNKVYTSSPGEWPEHDECAFEFGTRLSNSWDGTPQDFCKKMNEPHSVPLADGGLPGTGTKYLTDYVLWPFENSKSCELQKPDNEKCHNAPPCDTDPGPPDSLSVPEKYMKKIWPINTQWP
jgi:hypothetical protein